jgi:hypothetical protein
MARPEHALVGIAKRKLSGANAKRKLSGAERKKLKKLNKLKRQQQPQAATAKGSGAETNATAGEGGVEISGGLMAGSL